MSITKLQSRWSLSKRYLASQISCAGEFPVDRWRDLPWYSFSFGPGLEAFQLPSI